MVRGKGGLKGGCFICGGDHYQSDCPDPRAKGKGKGKSAGKNGGGKGPYGSKGKGSGWINGIWYDQSGYEPWEGAYANNYPIEAFCSLKTVIKPKIKIDNRFETLARDDEDDQPGEEMTEEPSVEEIIAKMNQKKKPKMGT